MMKNINAIVTASVLFLAFLCMPHDAAAEPNIGMKITGIEFTSRTGEKARLSNIASTAVVVLAFWAPEAKATVSEVEKLVKLAKSRKDGVSIVLISRGKSAAEIETALNAARKLGVESSVYFDPKLTAAKKLGVKSVPWFILLGQGNTILSEGFNTIDTKLRNKTASDIISDLARGKKVPYHEFVQTKNEDATRGLISKSAPGFKEQNIGGGINSLDSYRGKKPLFVVFWKESCPHCRKELPLLQKFYLEHKGKIDFEMIGFALTRNGEEDKKARDFVSSQMITFPIITDRDAKTANAYKIGGVPAIVYVDKKGIIRETQVGETDQIDKLLVSFLSIH